MKKEEILSEILEELNRNYEQIEQHEVENGDTAYFVQSWSSIREFAKLAKEHGVNVEVRDEEYPAEYLDEFISDWRFADEYDECSCCGKMVYHNDIFHYPQRFLDYDNCEIRCRDCLDVDRYIEHITNNSESANTLLTPEELEQKGFKRLDREYANGLYGRCDKPKEILEKLLQENPNAEYIFDLGFCSNPYETAWTVWKKSN